MFLLDTNVVSEAVAARPSPEVVAWVAARPADDLFISVVTISEIDFGILRLPNGRRRSGLQAWREALVNHSRRRLLPVDLAVAEAWSLIRARAAAAGRTLSPVDSLIAATAQAHGYTVVTRNVRDFAAWGGPLLNPWP